jgi:hypothetical protein
MRGDEVCWNVVLDYILFERLFKLPRHGRGRPTHAAGGALRFDGLRRDLVQGQIIVDGARKEEIAQIGFIPDLEVPVLDLIFAVARLHVRGEGADQRGPLRGVLRRSDIALPPEDGLRSAGELGWHEGELDEWTDMQREQGIVERVDVLEVVLRVTVCILRVHAHVIVQNAVHADVLEADLTLHGCQLLLPVRAQAFIGSAGPDHPERNLRMRPADMRDIGMHNASLGKRRRSGECNTDCKRICSRNYFHTHLGH